MNHITGRICLIGAIISLFATGRTGAETNALERPNVIVILTDDQGYGDIGAHGHPFLRTPNMDKLYAEGVRFTDFHVAPMCSPTRGELMTGVDAMKNGATAVSQGRSMVREDIPLLSNYFKDAGYATGIFGKWHLGDSYPYRPQDRGFQEVLSFRAWGLASLASNWENSPLNPNGRGDEYTDPMLEHNGVPTLYPGYSGDIFFSEAMKYMAECQGRNQPFFVYLADNLAHVPDCVPSKYSEPYEKIGRWNGIKVPAKYYGMIANIDENLGRLDQFLVKQRLKQNTILLFLSDNGTRSVEASRIYNGGMRGHKTELWDGGHRVHCFFRWPQSGIRHGRDIPVLTEVQDLAPTLLELCRINPTNRYPMSGVSLAGLLRNQNWSHADRTVAIQYKISGAPWVGAVVPYEKWRLLAGKNLYNVVNDPHQDRDVAGENPGVFKFMNTYYDAWHREAYEEFQKPRYIHLGHPGVPEVVLYASDWQGDYCDNAANLAMGNAKGAWDIEVESTDAYRVELSRWPFESGKALAEGVKGSSDDRGARPIAQATLKIGGDTRTAQTHPGQKLVAFEVPLKAGKTQLTAIFANGKGQPLCGAFYVRVTRLAKRL